jgi:hypothetical protein
MLDAVAPAPILTSIDVAGRLRSACRAAGGQKAWAEANGISLGYVNDVLNARRDPGDAITAALGLRRVVRYVEIRATTERAA